MKLKYNLTRLKYHEWFKLLKFYVERIKAKRNYKRIKRKYRLLK